MRKIPTRDVSPPKHCQCGRRISRYSNRCRGCNKLHLADIHREVQSIVSTGRCPLCGSRLRRNLALAGWWQCSQFGAVGFRQDDRKPDCSWQGFTH